MSVSLLVLASSLGNYLNCNTTVVSTSMAGTQTKQSVEDCRFGHLGSISLEKLAKNKLVKGFNHDQSRNLVFFQPCIDGKIHVKGNFQLLEGREQINHSSFTVTVMFVTRFRGHLLMDIITFSLL